MVLKVDFPKIMATAVTEAVMAHYVEPVKMLVYKEQDSSHWATLKHYTLDPMEASTESHFNGLTPLLDLAFLHDFFTLLTDEYRRWKFNVETLTSYTYEFRCMLPRTDLTFTVEIPVKELDQDEIHELIRVPDGMRFLDLVVDTVVRLPRMIYKVIANHLINVDLGVVGYPLLMNEIGNALICVEC
ncbi:hypothetical protein SPFM12_00291 [Salmonella phage SPFM12]|nr:hypothetical protein SPFM12_00291 [Salmonella phage SPFM12]